MGVEREHALALEGSALHSPHTAVPIGERVGERSLQRADGLVERKPRVDLASVREHLGSPADAGILGSDQDFGPAGFRDLDLVQAHRPASGEHEAPRSHGALATIRREASVPSARSAASAGSDGGSAGIPSPGHGMTLARSRPA